MPACAGMKCAMWLVCTTRLPDLSQAPLQRSLAGGDAKYLNPSPTVTKKQAVFRQTWARAASSFEDTDVPPEPPPLALETTLGRSRPASNLPVPLLLSPPPLSPPPPRPPLPSPSFFEDRMLKEDLLGYLRENDVFGGRFIAPFFLGGGDRES